MYVTRNTALRCRIYNDDISEEKLSYRAHWRIAKELNSPGKQKKKQYICKCLLQIKKKCLEILIAHRKPYNHLATYVSAAFNFEQAAFTFKDASEPTDATVSLKQNKNKNRDYFFLLLFK